LAALSLDLDLTALASALPEILARTEKEAMSYSDFALTMLRTETSARRARQLERLRKRSRLGDVEGLDGFDFRARPELDPKLVKELLNCRFVEEHRNVLCLGRPGLGKTRIMKALALAACLAGHSTLYVLTAHMLEDMHASRADHSFRRILRRYVKPAVLVLDEFGYEPFDAEATSYLFRLISARHRVGSIILAANTGFSKWKNLFPNESAAIASVDRIVDQATILRFTGKSWRDPRETSGAALDD
jgi:DNA replication protein DnaC